jgi:phosphoribosylaminoimidazolecarboxamide formyltransferase/IMP cyclohydrolase
VQRDDVTHVGAAQARVVTRRAPEGEELADLELAWRVAKHVRSNAIVLAKGGATVGIGGGQTSRVEASRQAVSRAGEHAQGAALASDGFFPFRDGVDAAAAAGVRAIVQPGGSMRDEEVITAADEHGLAMLFTGERHFRH